MTEKIDYFEIISHEIRRKILKLIYERIELSYTEILNTLEISDGPINFHLRRMRERRDLYRRCKVRARPV